MDVVKGSIYTILNGNKQFIIPDYQRPYSWNYAHCERLWDDIVTMQGKGRDTHFVGSIVTIALSVVTAVGVQQFMIIDGQQRMTTLTLLMLALRDYIISNQEKSIPQQEDKIDKDIINSNFLKNYHEKGDKQYKLVLTETDRDILKSLVDSKPIPAGTVSQLLSNYNFFADKIKEGELALEDIYSAMGKLQIVNITLERGKDDPQSIFESLNATGKALSSTDLIRNYVLMGLDIEEQTYVYEHCWRPMEAGFPEENRENIMSRFFRDYLTMKLGRIPNQQYVYEEFKQYHFNCEFPTRRALCEDIYKFSEYYNEILCKRSTDVELNKLYNDIDELRMGVSYPFLIKVLDDFANKLITKEELKEIVELCISYAFRRNICEIPTNSLNKTFARLRDRIKNDDYMNSLKAFFALCDDYKRFPTDSEFEKAFKSRDLYNTRICRFILDHLEAHDNKGFDHNKNHTIEHIMPQNQNLSSEWQENLGPEWQKIQKAYLNTIGNLTLTAYNSEMSDRPFAEKKEMKGGLSEAGLRLNKEVIKRDKWDEEAIKERANQLTEDAIKIWMYPKITVEKLIPYRDVADQDQKYNLNTYDFNNDNRKLFDLINERIFTLSENIKREFKKPYIAYKIGSNFADIIIQKTRLRIILNMEYKDIKDPEKICRDITGVGHWGNGNVDVFFESQDDIDKVMRIIEQSYKNQAE